ncbi:MAG: YhdP family protein [Rhodanobacteraceae bacterium]
MLSASFAVLVIALAVLVGVTQLAMPWLIRNPDRVEAWLTSRLGRSVRIGHVSGGWIGGGPEITLDDVHIGPGSAGAAPLTVPHAELAIDLFAPFQRGRSWNEFRLIGLQLALAHEPGGEWQLRGFDAGGSARQSMGALGSLVLKDLRVTVSDVPDGWQVQLGASELRVLNRGSVELVLGKLRYLRSGSTPFDLIADIDLARRSGALYLGAADVDLAQLAQHALAGVHALSGRGNVQLWASWHDGRVDDARTRVDLDNATFGSTAPIELDAHTHIEARAHLDKLSFVARWQRRAGGWGFDLADLVARAGDKSAAAGRFALRAGDHAHPGYLVGARNISLQPIGALLMLSDRLSPAWRRWLYDANPSGRIVSAGARAIDAGHYEVDAALEDLRTGDSGAVPGIELTKATLHGDSEALLLALPSQAVRINWPHVFRKSIRFSEFGGDIVAFRNADDSAWRLATDQLRFEGEGYGGELHGAVDLQDDASRPLLDVYASIAHADVSAAKLFWPINIMPPPAVEWLDRALVEGAVSDGRAMLRGDLDDWPFANHRGRFAAHCRVDDMTLNYDPEWPRAEHVGVLADFENVGLHASVDAAESKGIKIASADASIADLGEAVLDLSVKGTGAGKDLLGFLRATPIGKEHADALDGVAVTGTGNLAFQLQLPVKEVSRTTLDGNVDLVGAALDDTRYDLHLTDAAGPVHFNQGGFGAGPLSATLEKYPVALRLAAGDYVGDAKHAFEARLDGALPVSVVFARAALLKPALVRFPGTSDWHVALSVDQAEAPATARVQLGLRSDLAGTAIDLPAPLGKPATASLPFALDLDLPYEGKPFTATLGDRLAVRGRLPAPDKPFAARLDFGSTSAGDVPDSGVVIGGHAGVVDLGGWIDLAGGSDNSGSELLQGVDVDIGDLVVANRHFSSTRLALAPSATGDNVVFTGADIDGTLKLPAADNATQGISADFQRLHWPDAPPSNAADNGADAAQTNALAGIAPASLPPLHFSIADFKLGSASFGSATFDSQPTAQGMHIAQLHTKSPNVTMKASGDWTGGEDNNRSHLVIDLGAQNLGHMLDALGFSGLIAGGPTDATIDAVWPGAPSAFALADLTGSLKVKVGEGRILDVEPGAGRLFGLLSLREIPRRLSMDFSDFFKSGLGFNSIKGTFRLDDGNAYTDDLAIKGPAADIRISGRTGLRAKDYDQEMIVTPHAGATLPVVGAIAGGPVGAAAGIVIQSLLSKPIGQATQSRYHVTGSWEKPVITLLGKGNGSRGKPDQPVVGNPQESGSDNH